MNKFIDEKGRLFGKISIIDIIIVIAVIGLGFGYVYKRTSAVVQQIITADTTFYVTLVAEKIRSFSVEAVNEGDIFYKQHEQQPLGKVIGIHSEQAKDIMLKTDGTAVLAPVEDRYDLYITLEVTGSINETGYYINGNMQISEGMDFTVLSNSLMLTLVNVYEINEIL